MSQTFSSYTPVDTTNLKQCLVDNRANENTLRSNFSGTSFPTEAVVGQICYREDLDIEYQYKGNGVWEESGSNSKVSKDIKLSYGDMSSLHDRLAVSLNDDGTLKSNVTANLTEWIITSLVPTYVSVNSFSVPNNQTGVFTANRAIKAILSASVVYTFVSSSTYNSTNDITTVILMDAVLNNGLTAVQYGVLQESGVARGITNVPSGNIVSTTVAGALNELDSRIGANPSFRNKIINGDFSVWQRGTNFSTPISGAYVADRWLVSYNGTGVFTVAKNASTTYDNLPFELYWNQTGSVTDCTYRQLAQRIESVKTFAGKKVTISFEASAPSGIVTIKPIFVQAFGSGGSPSATVTINGSEIAITSTRTRYSQTISIPSISGKTLGTNNDDILEVNLRIPTTGTYGVTITRIQLEEGLVATPFEQVDPTLQLMRCQRYGRPITNNIQQYCLASQQIMLTLPLSPIMRTTPTVTNFSEPYSYNRLNTSVVAYPSAYTHLVTATANNMTASNITAFLEAEL